MPSHIVVALMGAAATYAFLWALAYLNQDPREPTPVGGTIPFLSPLIGLATKKESYYMHLRLVNFHVFCLILSGFASMGGIA